MKINEETIIGVRAGWFVGLLKREKIARKELKKKKVSLLDVTALLGYVSSAKTILKYNKIED